MRLTYFLIFLLAVITSACNNQTDSSQYILTNLNVIDIETGELMTGQSILIKDDRIAEIFPDGSMNPTARQTISMNGKFVIPGLWDMHIHLRGGKELVSSNRSLLPLFIANGVTTVRDAGGDLTPSILRWRTEIKKDSLTGPYIYTSGPKIDGPNPTWEGSIEVVNEEQVSAALDSLESIGADYVKIYESRLSGDAYLEIVRQSEERRLTVTGHMPMSISMDDAIDAGLDGIEHLYYILKGTSSRENEIIDAVNNAELGFWQAVAELKNSYDEDLAQSFYQKLAEENVYVVPTLHIDDVLSFLHEEDHSDDEYLKYIPEDVQQTYQRRVQSAQNRSTKMKVFEEELNTLFKKMTLDMQRAGVKLLAGSDAGAYNSFVYPGISLHKELEEFVSSGLTPLEALQASSLNGAHFFNDFEEVGSIQKNKKADLLILNGNPLDDIRNTQEIHAVISKGELLQLEELAEILQ